MVWKKNKQVTQQLNVQLLVFFALQKFLKYRKTPRTRIVAMFFRQKSVMIIFRHCVFSLDVFFSTWYLSESNFCDSILFDANMQIFVKTLTGKTITPGRGAL